MLEVESNGEELILPLPENFKIEVDRENKVLRVEVPDGLVDVFVNPSKREMDDGDDDNEVWL
jgi:16S rRNA processing protein RimM